MAKISSLASDFKIVYFPIKEEIEGPFIYTEANPVTLGSTQSNFERWNNSLRGYDRPAAPSGFFFTLTKTFYGGNVYIASADKGSVAEESREKEEEEEEEREEIKEKDEELEEDMTNLIPRGVRKATRQKE